MKRQEFLEKQIEPLKIKIHLTHHDRRLLHLAMFIFSLDSDQET